MTRKEWENNEKLMRKIWNDVNVDIDISCTCLQRNCNKNDWSLYCMKQTN